MIKSQLIGNLVYSNSKEAYTLIKKSYFGERKDEKVQYNLLEAFYLVKKNKMEIIQKNKIISKEELIKKFEKLDKNFMMKYLVFEDLRNKGNIVKTALKFGTDFRVYEKGKNPVTEHAKWVVSVQKSNFKINWNEFSSKNRVAHSTKKNLLIAIVDEEGGILYYEIKWMKM